LGKKRKKHKQQKQERDEINISAQDIKDKSNKFIDEVDRISENKYIKYAWITLLVIILIIISSYVRLGPLNLPITDTWAENMVDGNIKNAIEQQVRAQNPNLPENSIQRLIDENYAQYYEQNKAQLETQKEQISKQYKEQLQNDEGMTYLLGIDEYFFYSYAKWYDRTGFFGTDIVDGEERFMLRKGRFGETSIFRTHPFLIKTVKDIWQPINPDFDIEWSAFYIAVILMGVASIPLFFLTKKIGGTTGGFIAATLVLTAIPLVTRTLGGSSDDDVHTVLWTFLMMALFVNALGKKTKTIAIMAGLTGLANAIFMITWSGWWYGYLLVLGSAGLYIIYEYVRYKIEKRKLTKNNWINKSTFLVVFFFSAVIFSMIISPIANQSAGEMATRVITAPGEPIKLVLRLGAGADVNVGAGEYPLWPNVLRTVAELNPASIRQIISGAGALPLGKDTGILFFYLSLAGIITLFFRYKENSNYPLFGLILLIWMGGMIFVAQSAVRFILMASIPILIGVGALIGAITGPVSKYLSKETKIKKTVFVAAFSILLVMWFLWTPINNARGASEGAIPIFDDAWYEAIYEMKAHSGDERGIVSSWWDYGHFFQAYGEQTVTFDGADQGKRIYWMGRALLTDNPDEAHNILKVMNCGQERPYDILESELDGRYKPTQIKLAIAQMTRDEAKEYMQDEGLSDEIIEEILALTHCDDLMPMYFVTSGDMVGKAGVWAHFGGWNFTRSYFYYNLKNFPLAQAEEIAKENTNLSGDEIRRLYNEARLIRNENDAAQWISPFINYYTREKTSCTENNNTITCNYNIGLQQDATVTVVLRRVIIPLNNIQETQILLQTVNRQTNAPLRQDIIKPTNVVIERDGEFETYKMNNSGIEADILLMDEDTGYKSLITHPDLTKSVFTRLFFMEGRGDDLSMFNRISDKTSFRGERIIIWEAER
jgi:dolichyl-diphosphooligosaccharide--protein glycosyltransferase